MTECNNKFGSLVSAACSMVHMFVCFRSNQRQQHHPSAFEEQLCAGGDQGCSPSLHPLPQTLLRHHSFCCHHSIYSGRGRGHGTQSAPVGASHPTHLTGSCRLRNGEGGYCVSQAKFTIASHDGHSPQKHKNSAFQSYNITSPC